jgi:hypothetical protein
MERNSRIIVAVAICALVFMCFVVEQTSVMAEEAFGYTTTKHQKWSTSSLSWKGLQSNGAGLSTTDHEEANPTRRKLNQFLPDPSSFGNFISWQSLLQVQAGHTTRLTAIWQRDLSFLTTEAARRSRFVHEESDRGFRRSHSTQNTALHRYLQQVYFNFLVLICRSFLCSRTLRKTSFSSSSAEDINLQTEIRFQNKTSSSSKQRLLLLRVFFFLHFSLQQRNLLFTMWTSPTTCRTHFSKQCT